MDRVYSGVPASLFGLEQAIEVSPVSGLSNVRFWLKEHGYDPQDKVLCDAVFALAFGLYTYVNPVPTVTGGPDLVKLLTQDCRQVTGGVLDVETDSVKAADSILAHIESNRKKLGI